MEWSEKVPVAVNGSVVPLAMLGLAGVTAIDSRTAGLTVSTVEPLIPPIVALMLDVPVATAVARPPPRDGGDRRSWPTPRSPGRSGPRWYCPRGCRWP